MKIRMSTLTLLAIGSFVLVSTLLAAATVGSILASEREEEAVREQSEMRDLGMELVLASDRLTRFARYFAVDGDPADLRAFWEEREVKRTRERVLARVRELGATGDELALIASAKRHSDDLVIAETQSMRLVLESQGVAPARMPAAVRNFTLAPYERSLTPERKRAVAIEILFSQYYREQKAAVRAAFDDFRAATGRRTEAAASAARLEEDRWQTGLAVLAVVAALLVAAVLVLAHRLVVGPVRAYSEALSGRSSRDLDFALAPAGTVELQRLARAFNESLQSRRHALTDDLTGLGNRRRLLADLDEAARDATPAAPVVLALFDLDGFKRYNDTYGHPAGDALLARIGRRLEGALGARGRAYRLGGDEFCILLPGAVGADDAVADAVAALTEDGHSFAVRPSAGVAQIPADATAPADALKLADQRMYGHKGAGRGLGDRAARDLLLGVIGEQQPGLHEHSSGVAALAVVVARAMGLPEAECDRVGQAAELHDIGKVAIPAAILDKPGSLTGDEWDYMRRHTVIGERILAAAAPLAPVAGLVRSSHERWDGRGYPDGLAGEAIPLGARIVAVCDAFDAMTTERPYRPALSRAEALAELERCAGRQFDPAVVAAFVEAVRGLDDLPLAA